MTPPSPDETVDFDIEAWLKPVKVSRKDLRRIIYWSIANEGKTLYKNLLSCAKGHKIVTIDQTDHEHRPTEDCPKCGNEMRSWFYLCDQALKPTHRYYEATGELASQLDPSAEKVVLLGPILPPLRKQVSASDIAKRLKPSPSKPK